MKADSNLSDAECLREAIAIAVANAALEADGGGPFGAVIAKDGLILARGANSVTRSKDPTAHAEVVAIREACLSLGSHRLDGCVLFTSCEPCPMCLAAALWARVDRIVFASDRKDAAAAGFDDEAFYREVSLAPEARATPCRQDLRDEGWPAFEAWKKNIGREAY